MSDLLSLRVLAGEISEEKRIDAASCWHFCYPTGLACFPPGAVHEAAFLRAAPLCPLMLPLFPLLKTWVSGGQNPAGSGEGPPSVWGASHCAHRPSSGCQSQWKGRWSFHCLEDIEWGAFHYETFIVRQPCSPRFLSAFHPLHRVGLLLIVCSVRNRCSNLLSTYCIPRTKLFMWMISLDFQNWYE